MKVLWLRPDKPDNISVGRHRIADNLRSSGHEVEIWNTDFGTFRDVLSADPDVIVGTTRLGALVGVWKKIVHGTPLVVDHIDPISQLRRTSSPVKTWMVAQLEKIAFSVADHVLVVYQEELPRVERYASTVTKTKLGVDYEEFASPPTEVRERAREMLDERTRSDLKTVIYIGGLEPPYHVPTVIEAMDHLHDWQFVVLGDGQQRDIVERAHADRDDVWYHGTVDHEVIPGFLHEADVGICLMNDRNTLKILEYGAARLPTVSVEGDAEAKFEGLVEFCSLDPSDVARAIDDAAADAPVDAFQEFTARFGWTEIAKQYEEALHSVVAETDGSSSGNGGP